MINSEEEQNKMGQLAHFYRLNYKGLQKKAKPVFFVIGVMVTLYLSMQLWPEDPQVLHIPTNKQAVLISSSSY